MTTAGNSSAGHPGRWAWVEIDAAAITHNVDTIRRLVAPASVWAVVKADGYGHGAVTAAHAALAGGATGLCVALCEEGVELRSAGLAEVPVLVLSQQPAEQFPIMITNRLTPTLYTRAGVRGFADAVDAAGLVGYPVHLKFDTGMRRVGAMPVEASALAAEVAEATPALRLEGVFTHLAMADEPDDPATDFQLDSFDAVLGELAADGQVPELVHAANSAAALVHPRARRSIVRVGIAAYGIEPGAAVAGACRQLRPALRLVARVGHVKRVHAGERISYGLRHTFSSDTTVATVPIGYADGVPRRLSSVGGEVLVGGTRCPIVGVVTMDQLMVDCGDLPVQVGDEVVLLGAQGAERIRPEDWADRLGTIAYEIVCGISKRIGRTTTGR